jgi:hypothetical protein
VRYPEKNPVASGVANSSKMGELSFGNELREDRESKSRALKLKTLRP